MGVVLTAPLAIISIDGTIIGKMKTVRANETYRRGSVTGIGRFNKSEVPLVEFTGTLNCSFYTVNFLEHPLFHKAILRKTNTVEKFLNTMALQEIGLKIDFFRKVADKAGFPPEGRDANQIIQEAPPELFATIENAFITGDNFDISEGQISGHDSTFEYLDPITALI